MTRVNCVDPKLLSPRHLIAEYRELPRIYELARKASKRSEEVDIPSNYCMGTGHQKFFYNKLAWCDERYAALVKEMYRRGYLVRFPEPPNHSDLSSWWNRSWRPNDKDKLVNFGRLFERSPDYYSQVLYPE